MDTEGEPEIDSDLEDPDLDDLESLRKALGTHYTAVSPPLRPSHTLRDIHMARNAQQCLKTAVRRADEFPFVMASRGAMTQIVRVIRMGKLSRTPSSSAGAMLASKSGKAKASTTQML